MNIKTKTHAEKLVGGLTSASKMPCPSWNLDARFCQTGHKLAKIPGTVCAICYALKNNYIKYAATIRPAMARRMEASKKWYFVPAMSFICRNLPFFRWFDSGDIQDMKHLIKIVRIAKNCPNCLFWLPTKEYALIRRYTKNRKFPKNLVPRISSPRIGQKPLSGFSHTSTVSAGAGFTCPAIAVKIQGKNGKWKARGTCDRTPCKVQNAKQEKMNAKDCRACWNTRIKNIDYNAH